MRILMLTSFELLICVTPSATGSELAITETKYKVIPPLTPRCWDGFYSAKSNADKLPIFRRESTNHHWGWVPDNATHLKQVVTWKVLYLVAIKDYDWFNLIFQQ